MSGNEGDGNGDGGTVGGSEGASLDRLASDGSKYFKSQQQKDSLEEAYTSPFFFRLETERKREKEKERKVTQRATKNRSKTLDASTTQKTLGKNNSKTQKTKTRPPLSAMPSPATWACPQRHPSRPGSSGGG